MNSKIYLGYVEHERYQPVSHTFRYPIYFYGLDLDELDHLDQKLFFFGYNRLRPASIHDSDYLDERPGSIKDKLLGILQKKDPSIIVSSIFMITSMRYLNYAFNPVSFYYCFDGNDQISAMVVEVNNTFGERHIYIPEKKIVTASPVRIRYTLQKKPFMYPRLTIWRENMNFSFRPRAMNRAIKSISA